MKYLSLIFIVILLFSCKSSQLNMDKISFHIEDTMFENRESQLHTINTNLYSLYQDKTTLVIFNGRKISLKKLDSLKQEIDSTFNISIFKDKADLKKFKVNKKYKSLILINKNS